MKTLCSLAMLLLLALPLPARAADPPGARFETHTNLPYYSGAGADKYRHRLDLYVPKGAKNVPLMMFVHGGGFTVGIKDQYAFVGQVFASHGIATAVISYRLSPKTSYPGHVQDTARAFAWLRAHGAEYGAKTDKIFISGHSAGATLVAMLGSDPAYLHDIGESIDHIAGVIPISGSFRQSARSAMFDGPTPPDANIVMNASAINHVAGPHPPFLILYGDRDLPRTGEDAHMDMITGVTDPADAGLTYMLTFLRAQR